MLRLLPVKSPSRWSQPVDWWWVAQPCKALGTFSHLQMAPCLALCLTAEPGISSPSRVYAAPPPKDHPAEQPLSARSPCLTEMSKPLSCNQQGSLVMLKGWWMSKIWCLMGAIGDLCCSGVAALCCDTVQGWTQPLETRLCSFHLVFFFR